MRKISVFYLLLAALGVVFAGGCAKKELVKHDESIAPTVASPSASAETAKAIPVKEEHVKQESVKESRGPVAQNEQLKDALNRIYFDFDKYNLSETSRATLVDDAKLLRKDPSEKIRIEGNCDERGSDEYNLALGEKRARAAMNYLVALGIPADRLSVISYGKERPADPDHNEAAWAKNRRDEFVVLSR